MSGILGLPLNFWGACKKFYVDSFEYDTIGKVNFNKTHNLIYITRRNG